MRRLLACVLLFAPGLASAAPARYWKMVSTVDAAEFERGQILKPRFALRALRPGSTMMWKGQRYDGAATEALLDRTIKRLRKEGRVAPTLPGRTEGVFAAVSFDHLAVFRDDPNRSMVELAPADPARVGIYDRRHFFGAMRALDRAQRSPAGAEQRRHLARAEALAERYYLEQPALDDPKAQPEVLLGKGGKVVSVKLRAR